MHKRIFVGLCARKNSLVSIPQPNEAILGHSGWIAPRECELCGTYRRRRFHFGTLIERRDRYLVIFVCAAVSTNITKLELEYNPQLLNV